MGTGLNVHDFNAVSFKLLSFKCLFFHLEVDMCLEGDVCDQLCVHMNGSLTCDCHKDYQMNPATRECKAKGEKQMISTPGNKPPIWYQWFVRFKVV